MRYEDLTDVRWKGQRFHVTIDADPKSVIDFITREIDKMQEGDRVRLVKCGPVKIAIKAK